MKSERTIGAQLMGFVNYIKQFDNRSPILTAQETILSAEEAAKYYMAMTMADTLRWVLDLPSDQEFPEMPERNIDGLALQYFEMQLSEFAEFNPAFDEREE